MNYRIWILISLIVGSCQLEGEDNGQLYSTLSNTLGCWQDVKISNSAGYVIRNVGQKIYIGGDGKTDSVPSIPVSKIYTLDFCGSKTNESIIIDDNDSLMTATISHVSHLSYYNDKFIIQKNSSETIKNVKKIDSGGNIEWEDSMPFEVSSYQVENDSGDVYMASQTRVNFGDNTNDNGTWGGSDILVTKFNQSGREWIYQIGSKSVIGNDEITQGVDLDQNNNLYVFGTTNSDFAVMNSGVNEDFIIFKLDANGNQVWKKQFGTNSKDSPHLIKFNENTNEIWLFGSSSGDLDNDLSTGTSMIFLFKYDTDGNELSRTPFVNGDGLLLYKIFSGSSEDFYIIGDSNEGIIYQNDIMIMRVDKNGQHLWTKTLNTTTNEYTRSGQVISDKIYITGSMGEDLFVKRFDLNGNSDTN